jgi:hypothetical protein
MEKIPQQKMEKNQRSSEVRLRASTFGSEASWVIIETNYFISRYNSGTHGTFSTELIAFSALFRPLDVSKCVDSLVRKY